MKTPDELLSSVVPYAKWLANKYYDPHTYFTREDLYCSAMYGAMQCLDTYEEGRVKFFTYAKQRMHGQVVDDLRSVLGKKWWKLYLLHRYEDLDIDDPKFLRTTDKDIVALRDEVATALRKLAVRDKKMVILYYMYEYTMHEIARMFGISEARVSQVLRRVRDENNKG